eukprot:647550-Pyramimonas_sp.AAC.1
MATPRGTTRYLPGRWRRTTTRANASTTRRTRLKTRPSMLKHSTWTTLWTITRRKGAAFCALAVCGVCLAMSPTAVPVVSIAAGVILFIYIMQPTQNDDEIFGMEPMEVDSSSGDSLLRPELPSKPVIPKAATLRLKAEPEVETYDDEITGDGLVCLGDSAFLRQWLTTMGPMRIKSGEYEGDSFAAIYNKDKHCAKCLGWCLKLDADESRSYNSTRASIPT